ncbi:hypothetical protein NC651_034651 [Populus alba x Populus x berolinensis]|nr:hypothetical protein NC651_034642 [Populus alba x Populus x berolinensis]KAJ6863897.1 hypothetical protein NC651_034651 [Populus alba x Populus x berolinensis]
MRQCQCLQTEEHRIRVSLLQFPPEQVFFQSCRRCSSQRDNTLISAVICWRNGILQYM